MESLCILFPGLLKVESGFKLFILTCCGYSNGCMDDIKYENKSEEKSRNEMNYLTPALFLRLTRSVMLSARLYRKNNEFIRIKGIRLSGDNKLLFYGRCIYPDQFNKRQIIQTSKPPQKFLL